MSPVLLLIDVQRTMLLPPEPVPAADQVGPAIEAVLDRARRSGTQVVHIRNTGGRGDPDEPGTDGWQLIHPVRDGEHVVDKPESDSFAGTDLAERIPAGARLILVGMQSDYCVAETALAGLERGHPVTVVRGAHATYPGDAESANEISQRVEAELAGQGAVIVEPGELTFG